MDPRHLIQLAVVLDRGSITAAAQHLGITQPTLTRNMATLEMQAGDSLFSRSRFGVRSTTLGEELARQGRAIQRDTLAARNVVGRHRLGLREQLRIGSGPLIGLGLVPPLAEAMIDAHPELSMTVSTVAPTEVLEGIADERFDIALAPALYHHPPKGVERLLLAEDRISVLCGPGHPLADRPHLTPADFDGCDWLNVGTASPFQDAVNELLALNHIGRERTRVATHGDSSILLQLLMSNRYLAVLPRLPSALVHRTYPLRTLALPVPSVPRALYLWVRRPLLERAEVQSFIRLARDIAAAACPDARGDARADACSDAAPDAGTA
jgi:DNA-binding transcriptional LysR family regulator